MGDSSVLMDFAWIESSGSDDGEDPFVDESDQSSLSTDDLEVPFVRHGPLIEVDPDSVNMQRLFWGHCAMGYVLDYRKFSVAYLQHLIRFAWRTRGEVTVLGRDSFFYMIHFESLEDLEHMCSEGP